MKTRLLILFTLLSTSIFAQSIDVGTIGKGKAFRLNGSVSSNFAYYNSNRAYTGMQPYTYFVQGSLNLSFYQFSMPISYSYSNMGTNFNYRIPFNFNRLSLHPKYRWITAHIGDVSMNFSPYTLNGHQFTGGGLELSPKNGMKIGIMVGRLLKATEDDGNERTVPAFKRMGYSTKLGFSKKKYQITMTAFYAKDEINSLKTIPEAKKVLPKENLALSVEGKVQLFKNMQFKIEYASSALTQDLRSPTNPANKQGAAGMLFNSRGATEYYSAFKSGIDYKINKMMVSFAYERIDPGYQTLGAYYFNNDLENITLNASRPLFNNKMNLTFNIGYQKDNLNFDKFMSTNRMVGAVNLRIQASEKLTFTGNYSNFSTYTNQNLNKLDDINNINNQQTELNRLNYKQLSQNANLTANLILSQSKTKTQRINLVYSLASTVNEQGGIVGTGQQNDFHNLITTYSLSFPKQKINITSSVNYIYNDMGISESTGLGGNLSIGKRFMNNKLATSLSAGYNNNDNLGIQTNLINIRAVVSLNLKKHRFTFNAINMIKDTDNKDKINEVRVNFGYNYTFDLIKGKEKK